VPHQSQIDHEAPIADAMTCHTVAAAANSDRKTGFAREQDGGDDVSQIEGPNDELRVTFDHPVERGSPDVEAIIVRSDDWPSMPRS
jgi:hypothetical protein